MATLVKFYKEDGNILAVFPDLNFNKRRYGTVIKVCYSLLEGHSSCDIDYMNGLNLATDLRECYEIINSLNSLGYDLKILNKF